jgi:hypothetical protein
MADFSFVSETDYNLLQWQEVQLEGGRKVTTIHLQVYTDSR